MKLVVMKFGGSSLETDDKIRKVARHVVDCFNQGNKVVVVVSARGKTTDKIRDSIVACGGPETTQEILDSGSAVGERIAAACLAAGIEGNFGVKTLIADGRDIGLVASGQFGDGRAQKITNAKLILDALNENKIVVLAAYAGITAEGKTITLGRSGSDTFAVAVSAAIKADVCQIYTDVPGFFATNPKFVPNAKFLPQVSYWVAMEHCKAGAQVLKERSIKIAADLRVPLQVLLSPSFNPQPWLGKGINVEEGTWLCAGGSLDDMESCTMDQTGLAINYHVTVFNIVGVPNEPGVSAKIFGACHDIQIGDVAQSLTPQGQKAAITFYVKSCDADAVALALSQIDLLGATIERREDLACLTLIDSRMVTESGWIDRITQALADAQVNIEIHPTSGDTILLMVAKLQVETAAAAIAKKFGLC